jgi:hypothetical protein
MDDARQEARRQIVAAANRHRTDAAASPWYSMRHLQRCVSIVRRRRLVPPEILEQAGFRGRA